MNNSEFILGFLIGFFTVIFLVIIKKITYKKKTPDNNKNIKTNKTTPNFRNTNHKIKYK